MRQGHKTAGTGGLEEEKHQPINKLFYAVRAHVLNKIVLFNWKGFIRVMPGISLECRTELGQLAMAPQNYSG